MAEESGGETAARYEYTACGRAGELLHASDRTTGVSLSFKYDKLMRETERSFAGGARQLTAYDGAGRIASVRTLDRNGEVKSEYIHRGEGGKILATMDERGRVTLYGYDKLGRVSKVLYPFTNDILNKAKLEYEAAGGDRNAHADGKDITIGEAIKKAFKTLSGKECQASQKAWEEGYRYDADGNRTSKSNALGTIYYKYDSENRLASYGVTAAADTARLEYDADGNLVGEVTPTKDASYAYNYGNRMAESHITEIRDGSRQTPKDTVYAYDSFGRRILEADILNRWIRHTEYRGLSMEVWKNAAVHGIKEPRDSRGIDSTGMVFRGMQDFLPAFADFSRGSPYDFTHVALTLPLGMGGDVFGLLQTEHSGIGFNPFVNASHTDAERHYFGKDHLGSVRAVTNQWGSPLYMFDYDVFGTPLQDRPERYRHGFTGKEYDSWTGLYNYGFRDYESLYGRFTTVDPIQDGHNWYAYVNSDPVSWLDPWGLKKCPYSLSGEDKKSESCKPNSENFRINTVKNQGFSFGNVIHKADDVLSSKPGKVFSGGLQIAGGFAEAWLGLASTGISGGMSVFLIIDGIRNIGDGIATVGMALADIEYRGIVAESTTLFAESIGADDDYAHYLGDIAGLTTNVASIFLIPRGVGIAEALQRQKALVPNAVDGISSVLDVMNVGDEAVGIYSDINHLITEETDE